MLMSPLDGVAFAPEYPELAGQRILVTGVETTLGVEIVRMLAEQRCCLVLAAAEDTSEIRTLAEIVAPSALELRLFTGPFPDHDAMIRVARDAMQTLGGIDVVINLAEVGEPLPHAGPPEIERMVSSLLAMPCLVSRIAANRMRTTLRAGAIINIVTGRPNASPRTRLVARIAQSALAAFTRKEAAELATVGIQLNAIAPAGTSEAACITGNPDIASLALHLASGRGSDLTGLVFEAAAA